MVSLVKEASIRSQVQDVDPSPDVDSRSIHEPRRWPLKYRVGAVVAALAATGALAKVGWDRLHNDQPIADAGSSGQPYADDPQGNVLGKGRVKTVIVEPGDTIWQLVREEQGPHEDITDEVKWSIDANGDSSHIEPDDKIKVITRR